MVRYSSSVGARWAPVAMRKEAPSLSRSSAMGPSMAAVGVGLVASLTMTRIRFPPSRKAAMEDSGLAGGQKGLSSPAPTMAPAPPGTPAMASLGSTTRLKSGRSRTREVSR